MDIIQKIAHSTNYSVGRSGRNIEYIVVHYTANNGDTAKGNCSYFQGQNRMASAHLFVDENEIYQSVDDKNTAWHCGSSYGYKHNYCRNTNSIGIEMCSRKDNNGNYYIDENVVKNTINLVKYYMEKYSVPIKNVIRHYDVTGKSCPQPFVVNEELWIDFKNKLGVEDELRYNNINELPSWAVESIQKLIDKGSVFADLEKLDLSHDMVRMFVFLDRGEVY